MKRAKVIVFEGADKVGKETQSKHLALSLRNEAFFVRRVEPAKETHRWGRSLIYWMLSSGWAKRLPNTFQLVQFLNKMFFQTFRLPGMLEIYDYVIIDRWALSGYVYGKAENIYPWLNDWMYRTLRPADVTLIMDGTSYKRGTAAADDSYEKDTSLQDSVREIYRDVAASGDRTGNNTLIDNRGTVQEVQDRILAAVSPVCLLCRANYRQSCDAGLHS